MLQSHAINPFPGRQQNFLGQHSSTVPAHCDGRTIHFKCNGNTGTCAILQTNTYWGAMPYLHSLMNNTDSPTDGEKLENHIHALYTSSHISTAQSRSGSKLISIVIVSDNINPLHSALFRTLPISKQVPTFGQKCTSSSRILTSVNLTLRWWKLATQI